MKELIDRLKNKNYVRAFGLMKPEEQDVLESVGWMNRLVYIPKKWYPDGDKIKYRERTHLTFCIKPGYQPEPELSKSLYEELRSISIASYLGNYKEPVWDGTVIGKPSQHTLEEMGLVECCHGYYFPTQKGKEAYKSYRPKVITPKPEPENVDTEIMKLAALLKNKYKIVIEVLQ